MFVDDNDAEVFVVPIFDECVDFNLVYFNHVSLGLPMDHKLLGLITVCTADGSVDLRFGRVLAAGSKLIVWSSVK